MTRTDSRAEAEVESFVSDDRGAVMVLGIFMCCILAGSLWYLAGIGDAIIYRERVQEAFDAAAFSSAALHARGLNLIVLLNLLMAIILGIRVAMKVLQLVCLVLGAVFTVICAIPFGQWACGFPGPLFSAANTLQSAINSTRDPINNAIKALSKLQIGIWKGTPLASVVGSTQVANKYQPVASFGAGFISSNRAKGLQLEESTEDKLCGKAGESVVALLQTMFSKVGLGALGEIFGEIRGAVRSIVQAGAAYFCEIGKGGAPPSGALDKMFKDGAKRTCNDKESGLRRKRNEELQTWFGDCQTAHAQCGTMPMNPGKTFLNPSAATTAAQRASLEAKKAEIDDLQKQADDFDEDKCRKDEEKKLKDKANSKGMPNSGNQAANTGQGMTPKRLIPKGGEEFYDGCNDSQVMGILWSNKALLSMAPDLVRVASLSHKDTKDTGKAPALSGDFAGRGMPAAWTQAEYFYDCGGGNFRNDNKCDGEEEAMWHFRWRPRLRRYSRPYSDVGILTDGLQVAYRAFIAQEFAQQGLNGLSVPNGILRGELGQAAATAPVDLH